MNRWIESHYPKFILSEELIKIGSREEKLWRQERVSIHESKDGADVVDDDKGEGEENETPMK
jgi:hypothetical protein